MRNNIDINCKASATDDNDYADSTINKVVYFPVHRDFGERIIPFTYTTEVITSTKNVSSVRVLIGENIYI